MKSITREELPKNALAVIVGRFACLHLGHQHLIQTAIDECGLENTLVIIGSENVIDDRTPFSPVDRATWIYSVFPCVCLTWIKDYDDDTMWENRLDDILSQHDGKPVFYTGSLDDVKWLSEDAMVRVVDSDLYVRRHKYIDGWPSFELTDERVSGTIVRDFLGNWYPIDDLVPSEIIPDVKRAWKEYINKRR